MWPSEAKHKKERGESDITPRMSALRLSLPTEEEQEKPVVVRRLRLQIQETEKPVASESEEQEQIPETRYDELIPWSQTRTDMCASRTPKEDTKKGRQGTVYLHCPVHGTVLKRSTAEQFTQIHRFREPHDLELFESVCDIHRRVNEVYSEQPDSLVYTHSCWYTPDCAEPRNTTVELIQDWVPSAEDLAQFLKSDDLDPMDILCLIIQVVETVVRLYENQLFHNDLHAGNVLVVPKSNHQEKEVKSRDTHQLGGQTLDLRGHCKWVAKVIDYGFMTHGYALDTKYHPPNLDILTPEQLQQELGDRGLGAHGTKRKLLERLKTVVRYPWEIPGLTVDQLRQELERRGLETEGTREQLVNRLNEFARAPWVDLCQFFNSFYEYSRQLPFIDRLAQHFCTSSPYSPRGRGEAHPRLDHKFEQQVEAFADEAQRILHCLHEAQRDETKRAACIGRSSSSSLSSEELS